MQTTRSNHRSRALIVIADGKSRSMPVAHALRRRLRSQGPNVDIGDARTTPTNYDAVIIGASLDQPRDLHMISEYIARHREVLDSLATGMFVVETGRNRCQLAAFSKNIKWRPTFTATVRDRGLSPLRVVARFALIAILRRVTGSRSASFRDEVMQLADSISREVRHPRPRPS